jgi:hypothetical protein
MLTMGMVAFFPWLRVREPIRVSGLHLFLHHAGAPLPEGVSASVSQEDLRRLLSPYRIHAHHAESAHCLLQLGDGALDAELDAAGREAVFRFARHLAVAGLATRRFDGSPLGSYSASGHYQVIVQQFPTPFAGSVVVDHRRKDGHSRVLISPGAQHFQIPEHLVGQAQPQLDLPLLHALEAAHAELDAKGWGPYEASITQFLMANSDSPDVPLDAESIATYAALERLVDADQNLKDFQKKLLACLAVVEAHEWSSELRAELTPDREPHDAVAPWLKDLYVLRGNAGHGYPIAKLRSATWEQHEHLLAGAFVYPLALKCKLQQAGFYKLASEDVVDIVGLDLLLGSRTFLRRADAGEPGLDGQAEAAAEPDAGEPDRGGWQRQMAVLGQAWASYELSRYVGEACDEVMQRADDDRPDEDEVTGPSSARS